VSPSASVPDVESSGQTGSRPDSAPITAHASPYGLGYATTGALLKHQTRMT
jgi:hypothetical protein